jgi:hypothetical protein
MRLIQITYKRKKQIIYGLYTFFFFVSKLANFYIHLIYFYIFLSIYFSACCFKNNSFLIYTVCFVVVHHKTTL